MPKTVQELAAEEKILTGVLAEFRGALRAEIKAAERQASANAIPLSNGERVGKIGHLLLYRFTVDSFLNLPGEMPGDLLIPGCAPIPTTIVGIEGLNVTLSLEAELPKFIPHGSLRTNLTYLLRRLIERIEYLAEKPNPAGERIRGASVAGGEPAQIPIPNLNSEQQEAVASSLGRDTTFIWGPPGTGKSETIGRIAEQLCRRERSVLLVSHTNIAVDEALLRVAKFLNTDLKPGRVIRVGIPKNKELQDREDLLLDKLIEKQEAQLTARKAFLLKELEGVRLQLDERKETLSLCEWVDTARDDLDAAGRQLASLGELEAQQECLRSSLEELNEEESRWGEAVEEALKAKAASDRAMALRAEMAPIVAEFETALQSVTTAEGEIRQAEDLLARARDLKPLRTRQSQLPSRGQLRPLTERLGSDVLGAQAEVEATQKKLTEAKALLSKTLAANPLTRLWKGLPKPDLQAAVVQKLMEELQKTRYARSQLEEELRQATAMFQEVEGLENALEPHRFVPQVEALLQRIESLTAWVTQARASLVKPREALQARQRQVSDLLDVSASFQSQHGMTPEQALSRAVELEQRVNQMAEQVQTADKAWAQLRLELETKLERWLHAVQEWGLTDENSAILEEIFSAITTAHEVATSKVKGVIVPQLRVETDTLNNQATGLSLEMATIEQQLAKLAEKLITEATVVAATLTGAYLHEAIQARRFDTVILDEASMAPIPALWVAASLATANVVAVGDFKQLAPIVLSENDLAKKWLGRDIFEAAGITVGDELRERPPRHFVELREQRRMRPEIRRIPNDLIYGGSLYDHVPTVTNETELSEWYRFDWGHDSPVLLVDTASTRAWVTKVAKGAGSSRLNFLSATVCVDLAEKLFRAGTLDDKRRILIICPYSPHAKLLRLLIKHQGLEK